MEDKIATGSLLLDEFIAQGYEKGIVTTIYGPAGSGKTNICMLALIRLTGQGKKIIYIDTESSFSIERLKQITKYPEKVLENVVFLHPTSFPEQHKIIENIQKMVNKNVGLIVIDTISMLYRLEKSLHPEFRKTNAALSKQIAVLIKCARENNLPIIITSQVYSDFNNKDAVKMVGGDILRNGSRCLIELQQENSKRCAILKKHRSLPEKNVRFTITQKGLEKV
jgi:DNA repair protein RadB